LCTHEQVGHRKDNRHDHGTLISAGFGFIDPHFVKRVDQKIGAHHIGQNNVRHVGFSIHAARKIRRHFRTRFSRKKSIINCPEAKHGQETQEGSNHSLFHEMKD